MKKLVAFLLVCVLWFGAVGVVHSQVVQEGSPSAMTTNTGTSDDEPFWDDGGTQPNP